MALTPLNPTTRYINPGISRYYLLPSVANVGVLSRAEINTGIDLTHEVSDMTGWEVTASRVNVPDGGTDFTSQIRGRTSPGEAMISFYASLDGNDIRQVLEERDRRYIAILHGGDTAGRLADQYPVEVMSVSAPVQIAGDNAAVVNVAFAIYLPPGRSLTVPA